MHFNRISFEQIDYFLVRLTALVLLVFAIYKLLRTEWPGNERTPDMPRIERPVIPSEPAESLLLRLRYARIVEWHEFPKGEEPTILTGISGFCKEGKHDECPGHAPSQEHGGEIVFCVCPCHRVPTEA